MLEGILILTWFAGWLLTCAVLDSHDEKPKLKENSEWQLIFHIGIIAYAGLFWPLRLLVIGIKHYLD